MQKVGVLIGSIGLGLSDDHYRKDITLATPWGQASDHPFLIETENRQVVVIKRHGADESISPHSINYRANLWLLHYLGVESVWAVHTVGAIDRELLVGDLVVPDQIIDYTSGREHTFDDKRRHIDFSYPFSEKLRQELLQACLSIGCGVQKTVGITYGCTQGPRLESAAEIQRMKNDGCHLVGMTAMPECALARELELAYASLCLVVNPAAGLSSGPIDKGEMRKAIENGAVNLSKALFSS